MCYEKDCTGSVAPGCCRRHRERRRGWLDVGAKCPPDAWTHVAGVYDVNGVRKAYVNGKLVGDRQMGVIIVVP
ncbi:MAG: hypothetical protein HQ592_05920 [Planctomycetes bacterium]|nr:hypothetical protein [Planctomycetota bacterium]